MASASIQPGVPQGTPHAMVPAGCVKPSPALISEASSSIMNGSLESRCSKMVEVKHLWIWDVCVFGVHRIHAGEDRQQLPKGTCGKEWHVLFAQCWIWLSLESCAHFTATHTFNGSSVMPAEEDTQPEERRERSGTHIHPGLMYGVLELPRKCEF